MKFQQLVLRMWPSFVHWQEHLPPSLLPQVKLPGATQNSKAPAGVPPKGVSAAENSATIVNDQVATQMRLNLLQTTASGYVTCQMHEQKHRRRITNAYGIFLQANCVCKMSA